MYLAVQFGYCIQEDWNIGGQTKLCQGGCLSYHPLHYLGYVLSNQLFTFSIIDALCVLHLIEDIGPLYYYSAELFGT